MTRPLVHLRERVRSERCSWGVINMENGREDRLRLGEEDELGRRSGGRKKPVHLLKRIRQADGNPPGADEAAEEAPCDDAAVFVSAYFPPGCGNRLDAARENDPQADRSVHDRDAKLG